MEPILLSRLTAGFAQPKEDCTVTGVVTDSRRAVPGSVFLAIKGERVNGEDFARQAVKNGACFVISENPIPDVPRHMQVQVDNVLDASICMGANVRKNFDIDVVAVTGSVGKTTTKDFIYRALSAFAPTVKSRGNRNNELGMPNTIYTFTHKDRYAVLEMGMESLGDIHKLSVAAYPVAGIITCIGISHLERLKTRENILKAKLEICDGMTEEGILVLNGDDEYLSKLSLQKPKNIYFYSINNPDAAVRAKNIRTRGFGTYFDIEDREKGNFECYIPTVGNHNVINALGAYTLVSRLGFDREKTARALANYRVSGMRQNMVEKGGVLFIEDCYNAAPDSVKAAVDTLCTVAKGRKIAVLGDMLELGEDSAAYHRQVGEYAAQKGVDLLWTYGRLSENTSRGFGKNALHFSGREEMADYIAANIHPGDSLVFKASHSMRFEEILEKVYKKQEKV